MPRSHRYICLLTFAFCLLTSAEGGSLSTSAAGGEQPMLGQPAPAFQLQALDGKTLALAGLRGKFVVLHFAASW